MNTKQLEELQHKYGGNVVKGFINKAIKKSLIILEGQAKQETPIDRGQLRSSWNTRFTDLKGILFNPSKYALFVQYGTKPHTPPRKPIEEYARRKGYNAGALRYSIKKKGTKANDFVGRSIQKSESKINRSFQNSMNILVAKLNK